MLTQYGPNRSFIYAIFVCACLIGTQVSKHTCHKLEEVGGEDEHWGWQLCTDGDASKFIQLNQDSYREMYLFQTVSQAFICEGITYNMMNAMLLSLVVHAEHPTFENTQLLHL